MVSSTRWFGAAALGGLALFGLLVPQAQAQFRGALPAALSTPLVNNPFVFANRRPIFVPALGTPGMGVNTNPYINPYTTLNQAAFNTVVTGRALSAIPPTPWATTPTWAARPTAGATPC